jgi:hypothetical protein
MYITPALIWYKDRLIWLRLQNLQLVAGFSELAGEDGGFHHRPHVDGLMSIGSNCCDLILAFVMFDFI